MQWNERGRSTRRISGPKPCRDVECCAVPPGHRCDNHAQTSRACLLASARRTNPARSTEDAFADNTTTPIFARRSNPIQDRNPPVPPLCQVTDRPFAPMVIHAAPISTRGPKCIAGVSASTPGADPSRIAWDTRTMSLTDARIPPAGPSASPVHGWRGRLPLDPSTASGRISATVAGTYVSRSPSGSTIRVRSNSAYVDPAADATA
jgi:hypothetical protein